MSATQAASLCCIGSLWRSSCRASCFVAAGTACPIETPADAYTDPLATTYKTYQGYQEIFLDLAITDRRIHFENVNIYASAERAVKPHSVSSNTFFVLVCGGISRSISAAELILSSSFV
jgi:hypothetical protein